MTPSKEALQAADMLASIGYLYWDITRNQSADIIDTAFAPYRDRVAGLIDFVQKVTTDPNASPMQKVFASAALAPFLEQETVT